MFKVIEEEVKHVQDYSRLWIGGFSQGACVTYNAFLKTKHNIGGVIALSGHTPPIDINDITEEKKKIPIYA